MALDIKKDAPELDALGITKEDLEAKAASIPAAPAKSKPKAVDKSIALAIAESWYANNKRMPSTGLNEWVTEHGITLAQARQTIAAIKKADAAMNAAEDK